jgi:hypothetical protein
MGAFLFGVTAEATGLMATGVGFALSGLLATAGLGLFIFKPQEPRHDRK